MLKIEAIDRVSAEFRQKMIELSSQPPDERNLDTYESITKYIDEISQTAAQAAFLEFMAKHDIHEPEFQYKGETFRLKIKSGRDLLTPYGQIRIERSLYQNADDTKCVAPLDVALGFQDQYMTMDLREIICHSLHQMTYTDLAAMMKMMRYQGCPHPTQMKRVVEEAGNVLREHEPEIRAAIAASEMIPDGVKSVVVSMDGANIRLNEKAETKPGRPSERPRLDDKDDSKRAYRNAMVGVVSFYGDVPEGEKTPERLASSYLAQMPELNATTFKQRLIEEVSAAFDKVPEDTVRVFLCDGATNIWSFFDKTPLFKGCLPIVDYYHATEHLSLAAEAIFGVDKDSAKKWFVKYKDILVNEDGAVDSLLRSMKHYATAMKLSPARLDQLDRQKTYFINNKHRMYYADYRRRGLPIGSGPVEAACKTIVKERMCRSGMRWSREGGQNILDIRSYIKSDRWDKAWGVYKQKQKAA